MKEIQPMIRVSMNMVALIAISASINLGVGDSLAIERLRVQKQSVVSCGYSKSINSYAVSYGANRSNQYHQSCLNSIPKSGQKDNGQGNGCSHQSGVGVLTGGSFKRKLHNKCIA